MAKQADWYPSTQQLGSPEELEKSFRETLRQLYEMRQQVDTLRQHPALQPPKPK